MLIVQSYSIDIVYILFDIELSPHNYKLRMYTRQDSNIMNETEMIDYYYLNQILNVFLSMLTIMSHKSCGPFY